MMTTGFGVYQFERIDAEMAGVLAAKSEVARLRIGFGMWTAARAVLRAAIVADHGEWHTDQIDHELSVRMSHGLVNRASS
jgi:hypothetical protein